MSIVERRRFLAICVALGALVALMLWLFGQ
jgi:hypothetical protein